MLINKIVDNWSLFMIGKFPMLSIIDVYSMLLWQIVFYPGLLHNINMILCLSLFWQQLSSPTSSAVPGNMDPKGHALSVPGKTRMVSDTINQMDRASKMVNDGRANPPSQAVNIATPLSAPFPTSDIPGRRASRAEETLNSEKQATQVVDFSLEYPFQSLLWELWFIVLLPSVMVLTFDIYSLLLRHVCIQ